MFSLTLSGVKFAWASTEEGLRVWSQSPLSSEWVSFLFVCLLNSDQVLSFFCSIPTNWFCTPFIWGRILFPSASNPLTVEKQRTICGMKFWSLGGFKPLTTTPSGHRRHFKSPKRQRMVADYAENVATFQLLEIGEVHPIFLSGGGQAFFLVAKSNRLKQYIWSARFARRPPSRLEASFRGYFLMSFGVCVFYSRL